MAGTKTIGVELKAFYVDKDQSIWPPERWVDCVVLEVDGLTVEDPDIAELEDGAIVKILEGVYIDDDGDHGCFESLFKRWRRLQKVVFVQAEIPKDQVDAFKAAVRGLGGKPL